MKQLDSKSGTASMHSSAVLAIIGFIVVACMFSTNIIVARANAGEIPSFSLAFFRWMTVAFGLVPFRSRNKRKVVSNFSAHKNGGSSGLLRNVSLRRPRLCGCCQRPASISG